MQWPELTNNNPRRDTIYEVWIHVDGDCRGWHADHEWRRRDVPAMITIPEPGTLALIGVALLALGLLSLRKKLF